LPFILDTDHLTILQRRTRPEFDRLSERLARLGADEVCTTIVSFHEQMRGWLGYLNRARSSVQVILAYGELDEMLRSFCEMEVLSYSDEAEDAFVALRKQRVRIATLDLRIASIALGTGSTLLTRNLRDFRHVPGLTVEDWTI
jgi:tRNA(fMet)-specific endonuclease VapC